MLPWYLQFSPGSFHDLLTPSYANIRLLTWLLAWNPLVFPDRKLPDSVKKARALVAGQARVDRVPLGTYFSGGRPQPPIVVLTGPTGCGKSTLARVAANQAGYSTIVLDLASMSEHDALETVNRFLQTSWFGPGFSADKRPPCLVVEWAVESPAVAARLAQLAQGAAQPRKGLTRPVIVCTGDFYDYASLRSLRQHSARIDCSQQGQDLAFHLGRMAATVAARMDLQMEASVVGLLARQCGCDLRASLLLLEAAAADSRQLNTELAATLPRAASGPSLGLLAHAALLGRLPPDGALAANADFAEDSSVFNAPRVNSHQLRGYCRGADDRALLPHLWELGLDLLPVTRSEAAIAAEIADLGSDMDVLAATHADDTALSFLPLHYFALLGSRTAAVPTRSHSFVLPPLTARLSRETRDANALLAQVRGSAPRRSVECARTLVQGELPFLDVIAHPRAASLQSPSSFVLQSVRSALSDWGLRFSANYGRNELTPPISGLVTLPVNAASEALTRETLSTADFVILRSLTTDEPQFEPVSAPAAREETRRPASAATGLFRPRVAQSAVEPEPLAVNCVFNRGVTKAVRRPAPLALFT